MEKQVPINKLTEVSRVLDSCLTEETFDQLVPGVVLFCDLRGEGIRRKVFVYLLKHAGNELTRQLNRELSPEEVIFTFERVKKFLTARELY